jgi:hypothetical protein
VATHLKSEAKSVECNLQVMSIINENRRLGTRHVLCEFAEKVDGESRCSRRKEPYMEEFVRIWVDSGVQLPALVVKLNYGFIDGDVIRLHLSSRL